MKVKDILKNFKYINPFYWINREKNRKIYSIILIAKTYYINTINQTVCIGLCHAFVYAYKKINIDIYSCELESKIPKFNRKFLNAKYKNKDWWWDPADYRSRLNAFEKLLTYYKERM